MGAEDGEKMGKGEGGLDLDICPVPPPRVLVTPLATGDFVGLLEPVSLRSPPPKRESSIYGHILSLTNGDIWP